MLRRGLTGFPGKEAFSRNAGGWDCEARQTGILWAEAQAYCLLPLFYLTPPPVVDLEFLRQQPPRGWDKTIKTQKTLETL